MWGEGPPLPCLLSPHLPLAVAPEAGPRPGFLWRLRDRQDRFSHWPLVTAQSPALLASREVRTGLKVPTLGSRITWSVSLATSPLPSRFRGFPKVGSLP